MGFPAAFFMITENIGREEWLSEEDLKTVAKTIMAEEDIREFVELKNYREDATYSISVEYERGLAENLGEKAIEFVNKVERII